MRKSTSSGMFGKIKSWYAGVNKTAFYSAVALLVAVAVAFAMRDQITAKVNEMKADQNSAVGRWLAGF